MHKKSVWIVRIALLAIFIVPTLAFTISGISGSISSKNQPVNNADTQGIAINNQQQTSSKATLQTESQPQYLVPILLGKSREEILNIYGTPDSIYKFKSNLQWFYKNKIKKSSNLSICYNNPDSPSKQESLTHVREVGFQPISIDPFMVEVSPSMVMPKELVKQKPSSFYGRVANGAVLSLTIIWHIKDKTFMVNVISCAEKKRLLDVQNKVNLQTNELESKYVLSKNGRDWMNCKLWLFVQYDWNKDDAIMTLVSGTGDKFIKINP